MIFYMFSKFTHFRVFLLGLIISGFVFFNIFPAGAQTDVSPLAGRILLQVEKNGQAWYVDPVSNKRAFLGRPTDAFNAMRSFGLGVSNADLSKIRQSTVRRQKFSGRILLQVEAGGAAFYVNPSDLALYYLGRPADAFVVMRNLALGVNNNDLFKISVDARYQDNLVTATTTVVATVPIVSNGQIIAANPCTNWTYSDWIPCTIYGNQIRSILSSTPNGCAGGHYLLEQNCEIATGTAAAIATTTATTTASLDDLLLSAAFMDNGKNVGVSCKPWVNKIVNFVTGGSLMLPLLQPDNYTWGLVAGGRVMYRSVAIEKADRGDIVQYNVAGQNNLPHTAIIVTKTPTGMVWIHSNWQKINTVSVDFITYAYFNSAAGSQYSVYHVY